VGGRIISVYTITINVTDILSIEYNTHSLMSTLCCSPLQLPLLLHMCGASDYIRMHYNRQYCRHIIASIKFSLSDVDPLLLSLVAAIVWGVLPSLAANVWGVRLDGVASISRLLKIIGLFCKRAL